MTSKIITKENFLTIQGKRFHYIWLRQHCLCPDCRHPTSFQGLFDLSDYSSPPEPLSVEEKDEAIEITWKEEPPHQSIFPISWLLNHAYDPLPQKPEEQEILWDRAWLETHPPKKYDIYSSSQHVWMSQLFALGFTVLKNINADNLDSFISSIGPIHQTEYGRFTELKAIPNSTDLGQSPTGHRLRLHTDRCHVHEPRLVQVLYCVDNNASGGESLLVDGFRIAKDFHQNHPDYFQILTKTPLQFQDFDPMRGYFFSRKTPILELDWEGKVAGIYFSRKTCNWNLAFDELEAFYEAYSAFCRYLKDSIYEYRFRLEPGDCLLAQNFRIIHGRTAYDPLSGSRHLRWATLAWDYISARQNFEMVKHLYLREN